MARRLPAALNKDGAGEEKGVRLHYNFILLLPMISFSYYVAISDYLTE